MDTVCWNCGFDMFVVDAPKTPETEGFDISPGSSIGSCRACGLVMGIKDIQEAIEHKKQGLFDNCRRQIVCSNLSHQKA